MKHALRKVFLASGIALLCACTNDDAYHLMALQPGYAADLVISNGKVTGTTAMPGGQPTPVNGSVESGRLDLRRQFRIGQSGGPLVIRLSDGNQLKFSGDAQAINCDGCELAHLPPGLWSVRQ